MDKSTQGVVALTNIFMNKDKKEGLVSPSLPPFPKDQKEEWRPIVNSCGFMVSNYGRVMTPNKKIAKQRITKKGYLSASVVIDGRRKNAATHRLVCDAFVPNELSLPEVNHKDEDKKNNRADNLEWCNRVYNVRYGTGIERLRKIMMIELRQYDFSGKLIRVWPGVKAAACELGIDSSCIVRCANGYNKTYMGSIWLYSDNADIETNLRERLDWLKSGNHNRYGKKTPVGAFDENGRLVLRYDGERDAEKDGFFCSGISKSIKKGCRHKGYYWRFI